MVKNTRSSLAAVCSDCSEKQGLTSKTFGFDDFTSQYSQKGYPEMRITSASSVASYVTKGPNTLFYDDIHKEWKDLLLDPLMHSSV